uniref:PBPe domain-containing protein n=1 Tax=Macrostomum lignano TaxID=282301 RepID=A0A1I8J9X4_9PLAT
MSGQQKLQAKANQGATEARISGDMSDAAGSAAVGRLQQSITYNARLQAMGHYLSLPESMKRRVRALKKLQFHTLEIESNFYRELHALEMKYASVHAEQFDKRYKIVKGEYEPTDAEADWPEDSEAELQLAALARSVGGTTEKSRPRRRSCPMIHEHDEPILKHLTDIRAGLFSGDQTGFTLEFHFSQNEYFSNSVLTKQYFTRMSPDRRQPWSYDGPEIYRCRGCDIQWCKGKNVTVKILKKVQRHRGNGQKRTLTKTVETDSFFNFFNPPTQAIDDLNDDDEEIENLLQSDFEIGHFIRERIVSRAVLCFTGEGLDDDDEGSDISPRAASSRLVGVIWWFFTLILISSYTANLAAFLTVELVVMPIKNAEELSNQTAIEYGLLSGGSTEAFFETSHIATYSRMAKYMRARPGVKTATTSAGIERVKKGGYAFLMESAMIEYHIERECNLQQIGGLIDSKGYGIGVAPKREELGDLLTLKILELQRDQELQTLKNKWWKDTGICGGQDSQQSKNANPLDMQSIGGIFLVLVGGIIVSTLFDDEDEEEEDDDGDNEVNDFDEEEAAQQTAFQP